MLASALVFSLLPLSVWAGMYGQPVVNLDAKTFKTVMAVEHAAMVAFVAPWCGHCKALTPEYTSAAQSLSPLIPFYAVDCDENQNKPLCAEHQIKGFPTIKAFPRAGKGAARDYQGERKKGALIEYAKGLVPDRVKKLRVDEGVEKVLDKFLAEKSELPHALLIHPSTPSIPFLWKVLGHRLSSRIHMGYIKDTTSHSVLSALGVYKPKETTKDTARAVVWQPGSHRAQAVEYDGTLKFNALLEWLQTYAPGIPSEKTKAKPAKAKKAQPLKKEKTGKPSPVEEARAVPAEGVQEDILNDAAAGGAAEPQVPAAPVPEAAEGDQATSTGSIHEEL